MCLTYKKTLIFYYLEIKNLLFILLRKIKYYAIIKRSFFKNIESLKKLKKN